MRISDWSSDVCSSDLLDAALIHVYRAGNEIGRSSIIYGYDDKPTPTGVYPILQKDIDHVSNIYKGAPMPWMLRLTWTGISIHGGRRIADDIATQDRKSTRLTSSH